MKEMARISGPFLSGANGRSFPTADTSPSALRVEGLSRSRHGPSAVRRSDIRTLGCSRPVASHAADYAVRAFCEACGSSYVTAGRHGARCRRARTVGARNERSVLAVGNPVSCLRVSPA
jgi:hypothetical protein